MLGAETVVRYAGFGSFGIVAELLAARQLHVERRDLVTAALRSTAASKADFADALIASLAAEAGCSETLTFDKTAARLPGVRRLA